MGNNHSELALKYHDQYVYTDVDSQGKLSNGGDLTKINLTNGVYTPLQYICFWYHRIPNNILLIQELLNYPDIDINQVDYWRGESAIMKLHCFFGNHEENYIKLFESFINH